MKEAADVAVTEDDVFTCSTHINNHFVKQNCLRLPLSVVERAYEKGNNESPNYQFIVDARPMMTMMKDLLSQACINKI